MSQKISRRRMIAASSATVLAAAGDKAFGQRGGAPQPAAPKSNIPDTEWTHYAADLHSTRYSPLDQIDATNFNKLQPAWTFKTDLFGPSVDGNLQATPLLAKGRLYSTVGVRRDVICLDAATGEIIWLYRKDEGQRRGPRGGSGHGLAYWTDGSVERVLYVTPGYELISLDTRTGQPDNSFGDNGIVDLRKEDDQEINPITGDIGLHATPLVVKNTIVVGAAHSGGPSPRAQRNVKGNIRGYDVKTGKRKWIFHTIPQKGEFGYDTWIEPGQAETAGNTGSWAELAADPELGLVYVGVELPTGDEVGIYRKGAALFGESIVALDIETGLRKWHFQMVHHGIWDMDVPCASILCDIPVNGKIVKAIAQPTKQAFLYVLNRETGEPIWPIEERPVAAGDVPGEWYSPTQPFPTKPPAFDRQGVSVDDLVDFTPEIKKRALEIASHYKLGPLFTPPVLYKEEGPWATLLLPSLQGGANWPGGSYDPETHTVYIYSKTLFDATGIGPNANENSDFKLVQVKFFEVPTTADGGVGIGGGRRVVGGNSLEGPVQEGTVTVAGIPLNKPPYGRITAIDLTKGEIAWQVAHGETPDAIRNHPLLKGVKIPRTGQSGILGVMTTKTLVICGDGGLFTDEQGRKGARLRAYDKKTGEEQGAVFIPGAQSGASMTYMLNGQQYIVTAVSGSTYGSALMAFKLPGGAPAQPPQRNPQPE
jgi:quinoprotein glucose dehydrogenase